MRSAYKILIVAAFVYSGGCYASIEEAEAIRELRGEVEKIKEKMQSLEREFVSLKASKGDEEESTGESKKSSAPQKAISPEEGAAIIAKGEQLIEENSFDEALRVLRDFARNYPEHLYVGQAYFHIGMIYYRKQNYKDAAECFYQSLKHNPYGAKAPKCSFYLGITLEKLKKQPMAKKMFEHLIKNFPGEFADKAKERMKHLK